MMSMPDVQCSIKLAARKSGLTPHVIRSREDGERIKQAEFARMNWCAADVYELYGDAGMNFQTSLSLPADDLNTEVIYPDQNPRGESTPAPTEVQVGPHPQGPPGPEGRGMAPGRLPSSVPQLPPSAGTTVVPTLQPPLYGPQMSNSWNDPRR